MQARNQGETAGLRRMVGKMPPQVAVAVEPGCACDPPGQYRNDPALRLSLVEAAAVMIRQSLMSQTIDGLTVLPRLDDVPAGMPQNPGHVVVVVGSLLCRKRGRDERPHPTRQPFAFAPRQCCKKIVDPLLLGSEPRPQIVRRGFQSCRG